MLSNQKRPQYSLNHNQPSVDVFVEKNPGGTYGKMRGNNSGAEPQNGRPLERKPSKLEQMRADYQKKIMKEKEEKMVMMYEENQKKAMDRLMRNDGSPGSGGKTVREFFKERRRMEASGATVPPIDSHYRQAKGYNSPGGWSSRTGSGNSVKAQKVSAGRDRAHPLAPIRRPLDTQEGANNGYRSGIPQKQQNGYHEDNPFTDKPKLVKHKPLPPTNGHHEPGPQANGHPSFKETQMKYGSSNAKPPPHQASRQGQPPRQYQHQQQQQQPHPPVNGQPCPPVNGQPRPPVNGQPRPPPSNGQTGPKSPARGQGPQKMTDFQKWQMEQNKNRSDRLKKFQDNQSPRVWDGRFGETPENGDTSYDNENREDEDDEDDDDHIAQQERELMEQIARQQAELNRVKQQRHQLEEEEKRDLERLKKKEAMERARQKKLEEEERREEERLRREEEEDMKYAKQQEEKRRKEMEKQKKEDERRRKEEEKLIAKRQKEEEKRMKEEEKRMREEEKRQAKKQAKLSSRSNFRDEYEYEDQSPVHSSRHPSVQDSSTTYGSSPRKGAGNMTDRSLADEHDERPAVAASVSGANYYAQVAKSSEAKGSVGSLARCRHCGRQFAADRLKKHQDACAKVQKPRKEFDSSKKRVEGTELAKYAGRNKKPEPPKKKNNWRAKHEEFIQSLRYAKKVTQIEKEGGDLKDLPPPPPTDNPDLVPCPYCNRTFNETAAERHIPRCKDLKTRPPPMNTRRR